MIRLGGEMLQLWKAEVGSRQGHVCSRELELRFSIEIVCHSHSKYAEVQPKILKHSAKFENKKVISLIIIKKEGS
jgi:hypothetical protein